MRRGSDMGEYVVVVSYSWTAIVEADTVEGAKESALAMDEEIPCDAMGTDVEVTEKGE